MRKNRKRPDFIRMIRDFSTIYAQFFSLCPDYFCRFFITSVKEYRNFWLNDSGFFNCDRCQFIIATHSPFMLGTLNAKIYNLDTEEYDIAKWSDLDNVRYFYNFFKKHEDEFKENHL